jgi:hypothetical protein
MGHNTAAVNGNIQLQGRKYSAAVRQVKTGGDSPDITLDLSKVLPDKAAIKEYLRTLKLDRKKSSVTITDTITMKNGNADVEIKLYSPQKAVSFNKNQIKWDDAVMNLENINCISIRQVDLKDEAGLAKNWGNLYCITLKAQLKNSTSYKLEFIKK